MTTSYIDVLLYVPNLIGYFRVICALSSFVVLLLFRDTMHGWLLGVGLYLLNFIGDLFDGMVARMLNQTSDFGGVLDMVTDRCSTAGFLLILAVATPLPLLQLVYVLLLVLDISSHWVQMHSSLKLNLHHKSEAGNKNKNFLVRWFYQYYWFFGYLCVGAEFTYILSFVRLRLQQQELTLFIVDMLLCICLPGCVCKQFVNVAQLCSSCRAIAEFDASKKN